MRGDGSLNGLGGALVAGVSAALGVWLYWGFTVDDALITARVAHHLHEGVGYRFNPTGPAVDAVTPFGWAHFLSLFASGPWEAWTAARWVGLVSWILAATWLGRELRQHGGSPWPTLLFAGLAPLGAWASAGMETGVVIALVTLSTTRQSWGLVLAGIAAALRPELVPYAVVLALGRSTSVQKVAGPVAIALGPAILVAVLRATFFESPYPLSAAAKPAELTSGLFYVVQTLLLGGPFWLWLGPGLRQLPREEKALAVAVAAHLAAIVLTGGDWMVLMRLTAPVFPAALRIASMAARSRSLRWAIPVWVCAVAATAYLGVKAGLPGRHITRQRAQLVAAAKPMLSDAQVVAALDVGWLGVAHPGTIVDLAGVTDPRIAHLAGGHTTKRIDLGLLRARDVDHLALLLAPDENGREPWEQSHFARGVESRVARFAAELGCAPEQRLHLPGTTQNYLIVRCDTLRAGSHSPTVR